MTLLIKRLVTSSFITVLMAMTISTWHAPMASTLVNDAAKLYETKCARCHGADGTPTQAGQKMKTPDLRSSEVQKKTDDQLFKAIAKSEKSFHQFEKSMSEKEIRQLVGYIRTLGKKK